MTFDASIECLRFYVSLRAQVWYGLWGKELGNSPVHDTDKFSSQQSHSIPDHLPQIHVIANDALAGGWKGRRPAEMGPGFVSHAFR